MSSALHHAVMNQEPEMVRVLMDHGADARSGVYPHRDATSALTIAGERGYEEIVAIILEAEQRRPETHPAFGWTPLHAASRKLDSHLVAQLLDDGADATARGRHGITPLDMAAHSSSAATADQFAVVAALLRSKGAKLTASAAVALGDADWLRARHAEGELTNPIEDTGGLIRIATSHNRPDILTLLLDFGFDPDERTRYEAVGGDGIAFTSGMALNHCAQCGKYALAEMLLQRGADPNAAVYASGGPVFSAYSQQDWKMVELLERYGGVACATTAGLYRQTSLAKKMLAGESPYRLERGETLPEELLWGAACGGDAEIVRVALNLVDWPRDDPRWFSILEQPLRIWRHGSISAEWDRSTYLECFRLLLARCNPNILGRMDEPAPFGLTILHSVAGSREHVTAAERVAFATMLLDAGARLDIRDNLLKSTPLGWACRWGRIELVKLFLERGADPDEDDAEPWATPNAWAAKMKHEALLTVLQSGGAHGC
jgi:ankyrin repeat protein